MMNETKQKASPGLRIAAALCLGAVTFATVRIIASDAGAPLSDFLHHMGGTPSGWILIAMPFALFASVYVLITGRIPNQNLSPVQLEENPIKPKWHWVGMTIVWTAIAAFLGIIAYLVYFAE